jgi:hypothetical protein
VLYDIFMSLLSRPKAWQLYHINSLHPLGHTMTASVLNAVKETVEVHFYHCEGERRYWFMYKSVLAVTNASSSVSVISYRETSL